LEEERRARKWGDKEKVERGIGGRGKEGRREEKGE